MNIKLIYGSDTGKTEYVVDQYFIPGLEEIGDLEYKNVNDLTEEDWSESDLFVLGIPTWYDGELQSDWEDYFETFKEIDFSGKSVAVFGLGDQIGYDEWFCDGVGILAEVVLENGGHVFGYTKKDESYDFDTTPKSLVNEDTFYGLCLDEDTQDELTKDRVSKWIDSVKKEIDSLDNEVEAFLNAPENNTPGSKIDTLAGLTYDKDKSFMDFQNKMNSNKIK
jgi:flavodoxin I